MNLHLQDTCTCVDWRRKRRSRSPSFSYALTRLLALSFTRLSLNAKDEVAAGGAVMTNDAFVPPNPKLLVRTALRPGSLCATSGTKLAPFGTTPGSGLVRFSVGGTNPVDSARVAKAA